MPSLDSTEQAATSEEQRLSEFLGESEHAPNVVADDSNSMYF